ncbi:hypothetical protein [Bernardetia sp.]|uniref:hypothetical protein n=1 Tax=Bernardetia sp. TaxID=1937974 RepID=UPI0025B8142D|nr:hypothetical protein [Bernardetia sp.]
MIFATKLSGEQVELDYKHIEPLRKEILYYFDQNIGDIKNAYVPESDYTYNYWEYLNIEGTDLYKQDENFFIDGCLLITNAMVCEYINIPSGNQQVFKTTTLQEITDYVSAFKPKEDYQHEAKIITLTGLKIAKSISDKLDILEDISETQNPRLLSFYEGAKWLDEKVIGGYLSERVKRFYNKI